VDLPSLPAVIEKFQNRQAHIAIIGLGYVGLPLAVVFAEAGYRVTGIDVDPSKIDAISRGESYIEDIPSARLAALTGTGERGLVTGDWGSGNGATSPLPQSPITNHQSPLLSATTDFSILAQCDAVSICVPTPLSKTGDPDISYIVAAGEQVARYLHPGMVIVLESTTYPGTTREVLLPLLEKVTGEWRLVTGAEQAANEANGYFSSASAQSPITNHQSHAPGSAFFLAFSPERVDPGRRDWTTKNTPKVIGGLTPACLEAAMAFYGQAIETLVPVSSPDTAEMAKLFENTFRSVNIGLANELLLMCDKLGMDAWEVIEAAATKPFGFMKFTPGPGLGGHCIPIDPLYLSWKLRSLAYTARFIELASEINTDMPRYWVQKVQDALNDVGKAVKGSRILVLGVAYKKDVSDLRESPALDIIHLLEEKGARVEYYDPHVPSFAHDGMAMTGIPELADGVRQADCVVIATDHSVFDWKAVAAEAALIVDTRHVIEQGMGSHLSSKQDL
jgi:UDP-N-acetyl-D-glucosamine dehydrogenase